MKKMGTYAWLQLALYSWHQKCQMKTQEAFLGQANIGKQNINLKSLPYSTFEFLNLCPQHNMKGPYCADTSR
jgi:hypothetical protein